ncbi:MAG: hypothetical protein CL778_04625 [Chloroflexi bacterium]|nr:hypothetical protein [Chloroflexota bacterium]|tara:strand:- start:111594 stop:112871 length:1278 start_codon:yes stop_codon:yes gene_type:complete
MISKINVPIDYGDAEINVEVPEERTTIIRPFYKEGVRDSVKEINKSINNPISSKPLSEIQKNGDKVSISICDVTRAQPRIPMLESILLNLPDINIEDISILIATGTHRACTDQEIIDMVGLDISKKYRIVNHVARDKSSLYFIGKTSTNINVYLNKLWVDADLKITTGFVEPHFFAGFSGGPKMVAPGLAGMETIMDLHNFERISDPNSTWGITDINPIHSDIREIAKMCLPDFSVDVTLNEKKEITRVFSGALFEEHKIACLSAKEDAMKPVESPFDVVLTSNSGFPLDQNLYQAVKGMSAAARIVKDKGTIICASECRDGFPNHGPFSSLLKSKESPEELLLMIQDENFSEADQWQVQIQAQIQEKAQILLKNSYIKDSEVIKSHIVPISDINSAIRESLDKHGHNSSLCILPQGPQVIPYLI